MANFIDQKSWKENERVLRNFTRGVGCFSPEVLAADEAKAASNEDANRFSNVEGGKIGTKLEIPRYGLTFAAEGTVEGKTIHMKISSGRSFPHPYWTRLALDFEGMTIGKDRLPILLAHNPDKIIGYFNKSAVRINGGLSVEGALVDTDAAREFSRTAGQGAPFQASLYGSPSDIEALSDGESAEVNGHLMKGEGHVWRRWELREAGPAVFGHDQNTETNIFSFAGANDKLTIDVEMSEDDRLANELFAAVNGGHPELDDTSVEDAALANEIFKAAGGQV